jgi:hypothetical protein
MRKQVISIPAEVSGFQEDKDLAKEIRRLKFLPALENNGQVVLDFSKVETATQSFVHALIGEALKQYGEDVLDRIDFRNCSPQLKSIIELVVNYSLGGFGQVTGVPQSASNN